MDENTNVTEEVTEIAKTFSQAELDQIIGERLSRERTKYADYDDLQSLNTELELFGYTGTAKDRSASIKAQREEINKQKEFDELQNQSEQTGTSPELLKEMKELKKELATIKSERQAIQTEKDTKSKADENWKEQLADFQGTYKDVDLDQLAVNPKFKKFIKGKNMPLKELYEDFTDFIGEAETEAIKKVTSKANRSTGTEKGSNAGGNFGLSASQTELVDQWNKENPKMKETYQSYSSKLRK